MSKRLHPATAFWRPMVPSRQRPFADGVPVSRLQRTAWRLSGALACAVCLGCGSGAASSSSPATPALSLDFDRLAQGVLPEGTAIRTQFASPDVVPGVAGTAWRTDGFSSYAQSRLELDARSGFTLTLWVALESYPADRERWFQFRTERLRSCMEAWLEAHDIEAVARPVWTPPHGEPAESPEAEDEAVATLRRARMGIEGLRRRLREAADLVPSRDIETAIAFLEWLRDRHGGRGDLDSFNPDDR